RFFAAGGFFTPDRRAQFIAPAMPALKAALTEKFPYRLNTGRVRDQWHTMTRSGSSPRLSAHTPEPFVAVHPADGQVLRLRDGGFARVATRHGACLLKVAFDLGQPRGSLFAPIHWSVITASSARVGDLVMADTDPFSGQPEAKATPATIGPIAFRFRGFAVTRQRAELPAGTWWARVTLAGGNGLLFATDDEPAVWRERSKRLFGPNVELAEFFYEARHPHPAGAFAGRRLGGGPVGRPPPAGPALDARP